MIQYLRIKLIIQISCNCPGASPTREPIDLKLFLENLQKRCLHPDLPKKIARQVATSQRERNSRTKQNILCFYGKPGVGKSTYAKHVAELMGETFYMDKLGWH